MHYGRDLAAIHDAEFAETAEGGAEVLTRAVQRAFPDGGLVVDLGCGSGILSRALTDAGEMTRLLRRVHAALEPGGAFLFDSAGPGRGGPSGRREIFHDHDDWSMHVVVEERGRTLTRDMAIFRRKGASYRRTDEHHDLALYRPADVEVRLRSAGFAVRRLRRYADLRLPTGLTGFLATKPR